MWQVLFFVSHYRPPISFVNIIFTLLIISTKFPSEAFPFFQIFFFNFKSNLLSLINCVKAGSRTTQFFFTWTDILQNPANVSHNKNETFFTLRQKAGLQSDLCYSHVLYETCNIYDHLKTFYMSHEYRNNWQNTKM